MPGCGALPHMRSCYQHARTPQRLTLPSPVQTAELSPPDLVVGRQHGALQRTAAADCLFGVKRAAGGLAKHLQQERQVRSCSESDQPVVPKLPPEMDCSGPKHGQQQELEAAADSRGPSPALLVVKNAPPPLPPPARPCRQPARGWCRPQARRHAAQRQARLRVQCVGRAPRAQGGSASAKRVLQ